MLVRPECVLIRRFPLFARHAHPLALDLGIHLTVASALAHCGRQPAVFSQPGLPLSVPKQNPSVFRFASLRLLMLTSLPLPSSRWTAPRSCSLVLF